MIPQEYVDELEGALLDSNDPLEDNVSGSLNATHHNGDYYYYYGNDSYYYYDEHYWLETFPFEVVTLGYVRPILALLTAVTNVFVVSFFLTRRVRGRASNLLFLGIAFSDTMTGLMLLPNSFYVYMGRHDELSRDWCNAYMLLKLYFSRVFHTVSVWQTVVLGIQRYMCVCHPFISGRVCTTGKTIASIIIMYILAFVLHLYHAVNSKVVEVPPRCAWQSEQPCAGTCVYLWFSVVLQHVLPCLLLLCLTTITLKELRKANRRVSSMSPRPAAARSSRDRIITITTTLVVLVFLVPELPHGVYKTVLAINSHGRFGLQEDTETNHLVLTIYELVLLVSFHANFWIYCSMMHDFRHAFLRLLTCGSFKRGLARLRTFSGSASSRKSSISTFVSRTGSLASRHRILSQTTSIHSTASETLHAVIPLSPTTAARTNGIPNGVPNGVPNGAPNGLYGRAESMEDQNDDVFV